MSDETKQAPQPGWVATVTIKHVSAGQVNTVIEWPNGDRDSVSSKAIAALDWQPPPPSGRQVMQIPEGRLWYYSADEETWHGECATRADAIEEGKAHFDGEPFFLCEASARALTEDDEWEDGYVLYDIKYDEGVNV